MKFAFIGSAVLGILAVGFGPLPAIAQTPTPLLAQRASGRQSIDFSTNSELCSGRVVNNGQICVVNLPATQRPGQRVATMVYIYTDPNIFTRTVTTIRVVEMEPNPANLLYSVFVDDRTLPNQFNPDGFDRPLLFFGIRDDGAAIINFNYGQYPPQLDQREEANRLLNLHQPDVQLLITALIQTR
ncbi:MAG: hypothetical protein SNJ57_11460 [Cyanobacteriota bacterium]